MANLPPVVFDRRFSIREGQALYLPSAMILAGYSDPEGGSLTLSSVSVTPGGGGTVLQRPGPDLQNIFYVPAPGFTGVATMTAFVIDEALDTSVATFLITVHAGVVQGTPFADVLINPPSGGTMFGLADNDTFFGGAGDDLMFGDLGNDTFYGGEGRNEMRGGQGNDSYAIARATDIVAEFAGEGDADTAFVSVDDWATDTLIDIVRLVGTAQRFVFGGGSDVVVVGNASVASTAGGGSGNDTLWGAAAGGTLLGGAGDDILRSFDGDHEMRGGPGNDRYNVASLGDTIVEQPGEGDDAVFVRVSGWSTAAANIEAFYLEGAAANFAFTGATRAVAVGNELLTSTVAGGAGDDELWGALAGGTLVGNAGNDTLRSFVGDHEMRGGAGDDVYNVASAGDTIVELAGEGYDTAYVSFVTAPLATPWALPDHVEVARLTGLAQVAVGNATFAQLVANPGLGSTLAGGSGDTQFYGGPRRDVFGATFGRSSEIWTGGHDGAQGISFDAAGRPQWTAADHVVLALGIHPGRDTIHYRAGLDGVVLVDGFDSVAPAGLTDRIAFDAPAGATLRMAQGGTGGDIVLTFDGIAGGVVLRDYASLIAFTGSAPQAGRQFLFNNPVTLLPVGLADFATTVVGQAVAINVLANDFSLLPGAPALTAGGYANVVGGTLSLGGPGVAVFTPEAGFVGQGGFTYRPSEGALQGEATRVTVTVAPPPPVFTLSLAESDFAEEGTPPGGGGTIAFRIRRDAASDLSAATVSVSVGGAGPNAVSADDMAGGFAPRQVAFAAGETEAILVLAAAPDALFEANEVVAVALVGSTLGTVNPGAVTAQVVNDDAPPPVFRLRLAENVEPESSPPFGGGSAAFLIERVSGAATAATLTYTIAPSGGAPVNAADLAGGLGSFQVTLGEGVDFLSFAVSAVPDAVFEPDETYTVTLTATTAGTISATQNAAEAIVFNDDAPAADLSLSLILDTLDDEIAAGTDLDLLVRVTNDGPEAAGGSVRLTPGLGVGFLGGPAGFDPATGIWTFAPIAPGDFVAIAVNTIFAAAGTPDIAGEILTATGQDPDSTPGNGTTNGEDDAAGVGIRVEEGPPVFSMQVATGINAVINEDLSSTFPLGVRITRTGDISQAANITYTVGAGTTGDSAQADDLQDGFGTFTANFAAGFSELTLLVYTSADTLPEPFETFTVTLTSTDVGSLAGNLSNEYTIANDDLGPPPVLGPVFYFSGFNEERGRELWIYDTNAPGDPRAGVVGGIFERLAGPQSSNPFEITVVGGHVMTRVDENGVLFGDQGEWRSWDGTSTLGVAQVNLDAFDATLPVAERKLGVLSDGLFWYSTLFVNAPGDIMVGIDGDRMVPPFGFMRLAGEGRRGLTDAGGNPAYIALIDDGSGNRLDQVFVGLFEPLANQLISVEATSGDNIDQVVREVAGFSIVDAPALPGAKLKTVYFSGDWTDPAGGELANGLWKTTLLFDPFLGTWSPLSLNEFVDVNGTGADPTDSPYVPLDPTDLTPSVTGAGERLFFFGADVDGAGNVETRLYALDGAGDGAPSVVSTPALINGFQPLAILPTAGGVVFSMITAGTVEQATVASWTDVDGDEVFTLTALFQGGGGTIEHLTADADGNLAFVWDQGGFDLLFVHPANGPPLQPLLVADSSVIDEVAVADGIVVFRSQSGQGAFQTLFTYDIASGDPAREILTDEPLASSGTQSGAIGGNTLVATEFGLAFQAVGGGSFAPPFLYTIQNGGLPGFAGGGMNVATIPGFGFGSGIAFDDGWIGTGNLGAQLGLFRVDAAGVTTLYGASTNFVGDLAALGRTVLFGTATSGMANEVRLHDLVSGANSVLLANHLLGAVDVVGSRFVFAARNNALSENTNFSDDDDIWTLYSYAETAGSGTLTNLGTLPVKIDIGDAGPVRALDRDGTTFLGDDGRVFWLQQNDAAGVGSEIHSVDFATRVVSVFDLATGPASGAGEFGDAVFANGLLHFVGSEDGSFGDRAVWTLAPDLSLSRVTGPALRDPFGFHAELTVVNGEVFFRALDEATGFQRIFQMSDDGLTAELLALPGANPNIFFLEALGNDLGFAGSDANGLRQIFRFTPGSQPGLEGPVEQLTSFTTPSDSLGDVTLGGDGLIYFTRGVPEFGRELWVVDGAAPEDSRLLADLNLDPVPVGYLPKQVVAVPFLI